MKIDIRLNTDLKDKISVDNKIMFINYQNSLMKNEEINLMKNDVKILITKLKKLEKIRKNFDDLKIQYNKAINEIAGSTFDIHGENITRLSKWTRCFY